VDLSYQSSQLRLNYQFTVASSSKKVAENVFVTLRHNHQLGFGEAAPSYFYHESPATIGRFLDAIRHELGNDPRSVDDIMGRLEKKYTGNYAAKAAINMALYDLIGKESSAPVYKLFGISLTRPLVTSFTIGIDSLEVIREKVLAAQQFPILKIKLGTPYDYEIIETIRRMTKKPLRIDANEGWTKDEAVEKINWLATQNVELVEQPLLADDLEGMKWVHERVHLPVFADESLRTSSDLEKLVGAFDGVNIKLMKCGGLTEAVRMVEKARQLNLKTMLGCFIESSLGITAGSHIAPLFDFLDLDGALLIKSDPFRGVKITNGQLALPDGFGLGVELIGFE